MCTYHIALLALGISTYFNIDQSKGEVPPNPRYPLTFGTLHMLHNLTQWSSREEALVEVLKKRQTLLEMETRYINNYLHDYAETTGLAMQQIRDTLSTPEQKAVVVGHSAVLSHRMKHRYATVVSKLRELLKSFEYSTNENHIHEILGIAGMSPPENTGEIPSLNVVEEILEEETENETLSTGQDIQDQVEKTNGSSTEIASDNESKDKKTEINLTVFFDPEADLITSTPHSENHSDNLEVENKWDSHQLSETINDTTNPTSDNFTDPWIWPDWKDKYMSMLSFLHLQEVHGFYVPDLRRGLEFETNFGGRLNALHCAEIGIFALNRLFYYMAIEWLEVAKSLIILEGDTSVQFDLVSSLLQLAISVHNRHIDTGRRNEEYAEYYVNKTYEGQPRYQRVRGRTVYFHMGKGIGPRTHPNAQYMGLCAGDTYQTPAMQINLKCYYEKKRHPYLYVNPVKVEVLSENPPVFQFYELLSNGTIEEIEKIAVPRFQISQLVGSSTLDVITSFRTSVGSFFDVDDMPHVYKFSEYLSGLKIINSSEPSQVAEYTYGRFYTFHSDALEEEAEVLESVANEGDRVATMLFYLEIPVLGGKTPFCNAGVSAHAARGSAILWYNLYRNGTARQDVYHGACPVIHGHKIIINHWIRYFGNWNHYKCSLNQME